MMSTRECTHEKITALVVPKSSGRLFGHFQGDASAKLPFVTRVSSLHQSRHCAGQTFYIALLVAMQYHTPFVLIRLIAQ